MVHIITPYSPLKDLGKSYNDAMRLIPENDTACLIDYDVQFLTPDFYSIIEKYTELFPDCVLTCYTNRIHHLSPQLYGGRISDNSDIKYHISIAEKLKDNSYQAKEIQIMSGFLMVIPKSVWHKVKFKEGIGCLGVDSEFRKDLVAAGIKIMLMESLYVFHQYRLLNGVHDKTHLQ